MWEPLGISTNRGTCSFVASYEILEDIVVDETRSFLTMDRKYKTFARRYEEKVLALSPASPGLTVHSDS